MTEDELAAEFGKNGWKQLPDAISRRYRFVPAKVEVEEHHIGVYADKKDGHRHVSQGKKRKESVSNKTVEYCIVFRSGGADNFWT